MYAHLLAMITHTALGLLSEPTCAGFHLGPREPPHRGGFVQLLWYQQYHEERL